MLKVRNKGCFIGEVSVRVMDTHFVDATRETKYPRAVLPSQFQPAISGQGAPPGNPVGLMPA